MSRIFPFQLLWEYQLYYLVYTYKRGIKTIIWTDTLQTFFMILAVVIAIFSILKSVNLSLLIISSQVNSKKQ